MTLAKQQKQCCSKRNQLHNLLVNIFIDVSAEVYLLCTLAVLMSRLSVKMFRELISKLCHWWKVSSWSNTLTLTAAELCESYFITTLISFYWKCKVLRITSVSDMQHAFYHLSHFVLILWWAMIRFKSDFWECLFKTCFTVQIFKFRWERLFAKCIKQKAKTCWRQYCSLIIWVIKTIMRWSSHSRYQFEWIRNSLLKN